MTSKLFLNFRALLNPEQAEVFDQHMDELKYRLATIFTMGIFHYKLLRATNNAAKNNAPLIDKDGPVDRELLDRLQHWAHLFGYDEAHLGLIEIELNAVFQRTLVDRLEVRGDEIMMPWEVFRDNKAFFEAMNVLRRRVANEIL